MFHFAGFILCESTQLELDVAVHVSGTVSPTSSLSCRQVKVLDGEDEYYKLLSAVESIPEEEYPTSASTQPL